VGPERDRTREPQYQECVDLRDAEGLARLGLMSSHTWHHDPRRLLFVLSRYKFVARMFAGFGHVLEVGCSDAFATQIVRQAVERITAVDFDPVFVKDARQRMDPRWQFDCKEHDMLAGPLEGDFDGAYSLDVIEHIRPESEDLFVSNIVRSLSPSAALIIGTPSLRSQEFASAASRSGHVNCKDDRGLKELLGRCFQQVFIFSMNDEVVHTGFCPMAHYLLALCCTPSGRAAN